MLKLPKVDEAARNLAAYLAVSAAILDPEFVIPEDMRKDVKVDLRLIEQTNPLIIEIIILFLLGFTYFSFF